MNRFIRYFAVIVLVVLFAVSSGCGNSRLIDARTTAMKELSTPEVWPVIDRDFAYIARKSDGSIWYAEINMDYSPPKSSTTQIFPPNK